MPYLSPDTGLFFLPLALNHPTGRSSFSRPAPLLRATQRANTPERRISLLKMARIAAW
jgi:hypothetical protein